MTDDGSAPTIPDSNAPTHGPSSPGIPKAPDARYALRTLLGKGGMGEVWLAHDVRIDREIAIKLMRGGTEDADLVARFLREARVQGRLEHPSVVPVHDLGDEKTPYFAMKRLTGTTLADVIVARDHAKWPRRTLLARFIDICLAIELAHQRGVIHRDLKPANIMLGDFGETYVLDWGLSRIAGDTDLIRDSDLRSDSGAGHTEVGAMLGTPGYMSPEQMRGEPVDQLTDIYALGCILYELLVGEPAIQRERAFELTLSLPAHRPRDRAADVPPELDAICESATHADKAKRTRSARELADAVQRFLDGDRDLERRRELASRHAERAQQLLATDTIESRAEAMREAGSAIALDAGNDEAKNVLARLLLEPPTQMPDAARRALEAEREATMQVTLRWGAIIFTLFLVMIPVAKLVGIAQSWPLVILAAETVALIGFCVLGATRRIRITQRTAVVFLMLHVLMLMTMGTVLGPLLLLPIFVFGALPIMLIAPTVRLPVTIAVGHLLAVAVPIALEWLAIVPSSYRVTGGALVLEPWALEVSPTGLIFVVLGTITVQLISNTILLDRHRLAQDRAQEQLHVQKWQLEQLVPSSGSSAR